MIVPTKVYKRRFFLTCVRCGIICFPHAPYLRMSMALLPALMAFLPQSMGSVRVLYIAVCKWAD
ncbi:hypothetical protein HOY82DRAFT_553066 [Tuber indicum]|nr:hypothetical protein HOY82DRAFT_553066 [Tuber indicum]